MEAWEISSILVKIGLKTPSKRVILGGRGNLSSNAIINMKI